MNRAAIVAACPIQNRNGPLDEIGADPRQLDPEVGAQDTALLT